MKRCPTCYNEYDDRFGFCQKDGATLIVVAAAHTNHASAAVPVKTVTGSDEEPITEPINARSAASSGVEETERGLVSSILARRRVAVLITAGLLVATALAVTGYITFPSTRRSILAEISKGNLVKPEGNSAYDLFLKGKVNLSTSDITEIANQVTPTLENRGDEIIARQKQPGFESEAEMAEAVRLYKWLNELHPKSVYESRRLFAEGRLAFTKKDFYGAMVAYKKSMELDSSWALPANGMGRVYVNQNDYDNAKEYYTRATQVDPRWISPWMNLGELTLLRNDYYTSGNAARHVLELDPGKASAHYLLARVFEKQEHWCDAIREYQLAVQNGGNSASPGFDVEATRRRVERLEAKYHC